MATLKEWARGVIGGGLVGLVSALAIVNSTQEYAPARENPAKVSVVPSMPKSSTQPATKPVLNLASQTALQTSKNYLENIIKKQSPNFSKIKERKYDMIVLHTTEGSGIGALDWLTRKESGASAHYLIIEDGQIYNLVEDSDMAWHCRNNINAHSLGIECAGSYKNRLNQEQIASAQQLVNYLCARYHIKKGSIKAHSELDPSRRKDPGKENMETILRGVSN